MEQEVEPTQLYQLHPRRIAFLTDLFVDAAVAIGNDNALTVSRVGTSPVATANSQADANNLVDARRRPDHLHVARMQASSDGLPLGRIGEFNEEPAHWCRSGARSCVFAPACQCAGLHPLSPRGFSLLGDS